MQHTLDCFAMPCHALPVCSQFVYNFQDRIGNVAGPGSTVGRGSAGVTEQRATTLSESSLARMAAEKLGYSETSAGLSCFPCGPSQAVASFACVRLESKSLATSLCGMGCATLNGFDFLALVVGFGGCHTIFCRGVFCLERSESTGPRLTVGAPRLLGVKVLRTWMRLSKNIWRR